MLIADAERIRASLAYPEIIPLMREAFVAHSRGECRTPMPIHLDVPDQEAEAHIKSSYRTGGEFFVVKVATTFPRLAAQHLPTGNGAMLLCSARNGEPVALLADAGHLTDVRTAAAGALVARTLGRRDRTLGIVGAGTQARLQAFLHAQTLDLETVWVWGRTPGRADACVKDIQGLLPRAAVHAAPSPAELARRTRLIVTVTSSREPLLFLRDLAPGTQITAVGADAPGRQELDPEILRKAGLILVDSLTQCERLGELQHAPGEKGRAVEIGRFCEAPVPVQADAITVADLTGLGVQDLYLAEYCYRRIRK